MLYSGADLIRTSGLQHERLDRLDKEDGAVKPVSPPENPTSQLDDQTQGALLRFARFIHKEKDKKPRKASRPETLNSATNPYIKAEEREAQLFGRGHSLDVYV